MRRVGIILFFALFYANSHAQNEEANFNGLHVGLTPSATLNFWIGYQGKLEYGFKDNFSLNMDAAYLYGKSTKGLYSGIRLRPTFRYYFKAGEDADSRYHLSFGYHYRETLLNTEGSVSRSGGQFFERVRYQRKSVLTGFVFMFGQKFQLGNQFWIDTAIGLGPGRLNVSHLGLGEGEEIIDEEFFFFHSFNSPGIHGYGILIGHLTVGVRLF